MNELRDKRVLIIGGGIGGLAAAIALRRAGIEATVYESGNELREIGAGLTLWVNAVRALHKLGLADGLAAIGMPMTQSGVRSWRGDVLSKTLVDQQARLRIQATVVHRAELLAMLAKALAKEVVLLNTRCVGFKQDDSGVWAQFADGREAFGDVLIGADGIHSVIRAQMLGKARPRYSGYTSWRGVASFDNELFPSGVTETWGRGRRFGLEPLSQRRVFWYATWNVAERTEDSAMGRKQQLLELFGDWHEPIRAVIEATVESAILHNDIIDRQPVKHWTKGRVTLLGDAAHPMTPNLGQGACQAIEDAVVLAQCLKEHKNVVSALQLYEKKRVSRTNSIVRDSWRIGQIGQLENPLVCMLRDALMKRLPAGIQLKQFERIVGYEV
ncbi:MAG TPA: FAD-dependent monooxygenase [Ktedonobacteraceae bacterium]|nr:FAD-dependent monooxygenase [Ktedonobacteraceae bacterium]